MKNIFLTVPFKSIFHPWRCTSILLLTRKVRGGLYEVGVWAPLHHAQQVEGPWLVIQD